MLEASMQLERHSPQAVLSGIRGGQVGVSDCLHPLPQVRSDQWLTKVGGLCQAERGYGWVGWGDTGICKTGPPLWSPVLSPEA